MGSSWAGGTSRVPSAKPRRDGENRDKPRDFHRGTFLPSFKVKPPVEMDQAGSSRLENLMGQWESSQLAERSPQWEQPVLFPTLPFIPRARK